MIKIFSTLAKKIVLNDPKIEKNLRIAKIDKSGQEFIEQSLKSSLIISITFAIIVFFFISAGGGSPIVPMVITFLVSYFLLFKYFKNTPLVYIKKRRIDIDREILFAGRYLLVKIESGVPLVNSIEDASKSYGIASNYFMEILNDIKTGIPIEEAIENARNYTPSKYFKMIMAEILTSIKTGVDVSNSLRSILKQITKEQLLEIKDYAKKLNAFMMMYMMLAAVIPSLGMTIFIIVAAFLQIDFSKTMVYSMLSAFAILQFVFISALRTIRPTVEF